MSITAAEIQNVRFGEARRGYNPDEVDEFLERVATDVDTLNRALAEAANRLRDAEERARVASERPAAAAAAAVAPAAPPAEALRPAQPVAEGAITEEVISKAFIAAQLSADRLKEEARKEAEKLYREADAKVKDIVREAYNERERIVGELDYLRNISETFRTEFLSLIEHYSTDAQKRFADFSELVPESLAHEAAPGIESLLEASSAVVVPSGGSAAKEAPAHSNRSAAAEPAEQPEPVDDEETDPGATTAMPAASYAIDDDLEIEEID